MASILTLYPKISDIDIDNDYAYFSIIWEINDLENVYYYLGDNPKDRIVNALKEIKTAYNYFN